MVKTPDDKLSVSTNTPHDVDFIRSLVKIIEKSDLHELEYDRDGLYIRLNRGGSSMIPAPSSTSAIQSADITTSASSKEVDLSSSIGVMVSPMVGIAYLRPDPDSPEFIHVGASVKEGDTLLIIESMKVFNPIKASHNGVVKKIFVTSGQLVEFATPLVIIE